MESGRNPTRLGRWVWTLYRGKGNRRLRVVTAYRPCKKNESSPYATWTQHRNYFRGKKLEREPRNAILEDLQTKINGWEGAGEHVVLMMDCNEDVRSVAITNFLNACGLRDIVLEWHGGDAPRTHKRGSHPIDAIFATHSVQCVRAGYAGFEDGVQSKRSDHRCLWFDVAINNIFGHEMPLTNKPQARRLKCNDPRVVRTFNQYYFDFLRKHKLHERAFRLEADALYPLPRDLQKQAEQLDTLKMQGILHADKKCRKLRMGGVPYSKKYKQLNSAIGFWNEMLRRKQGNRVKSKHLQRLIKKAAILIPLCTINQYTLEQVKAARWQHFQDYNDFVSTADAARITWLEELAEARAEADLKMRPKSKRKKSAKYEAGAHDEKAPLKKATADQLRQLRDIERIRSSARRVKAAIGINRLSGITMVEAPNDDGVTEQYTDPKGIVRGCIWENKRRLRQTEGTPFMQEPLRTRVGYLGIGPGAQEILNGTFQCTNNTPPYAARLIQGLKRIDGTTENPIHVGMPTEEYRQGWK